MVNLDDVATENIKGYNPNWSQIPDHPNRMLVIGGSGSRKTNSSLNLINDQPDIDEAFFYTKGPYQLLII